MQIKDVSKATGLSVKTIRFYEERGLIQPKTEYRNGKNFRDYGETDVQRLNTVAVLRKCLFSLEQIKTMLDHPDRTPDVFTEYRIGVLSQRDLLNLLAEKAETLDSETLDSPETLARRLTITAKPLPLPTIDMEPHFGKFDPETPEQRQAAFLKWQKQYKYAFLRKWGLPLGSLLAVTLLICVFNPKLHLFIIAYVALALFWGIVFAVKTSKGYGFRVQYIRNYSPRGGFWNDGMIAVDEEAGSATLLTQQMSGHGNLIHTDYTDE